MAETFYLPAPSDGEILDHFTNMQRSLSDLGVEVKVKLDRYTDIDWHGGAYPDGVRSDSRNIFKITLSIRATSPGSGWITETFDRSADNLPGLSSLYCSKISLDEGSLDSNMQRSYGRIRLLISEYMSSVSATVAADPRTAAIGLEASGIGISAIKDATTQLTLTAARMMEDAASASKKYREELESQISVTRDEMNIELSKKRSQLESREASLELRLKEIDDRSHTHARRDLRAELSRMLSDRTKSQNSSVNMYRGRWKFITICLLGIFFLTAATVVQLYFLADTVNDASQVPIDDQFPSGATKYSAAEAWRLNVISVPGLLLLKSVLTGGAAVALLFYLLSWMKRVQKLDFDHESNLDRYRFDMERASWVLETVLEMKDKKIENVPDVWLEAVTRGMFTGPSGRTNDSEFSDALAKLLGVSAKAEFGANGAKVEVGRSGLKELSRLADGE